MSHLNTDREGKDIVNEVGREASNAATTAVRRGTQKAISAVKKKGKAKAGKKAGKSIFNLIKKILTWIGNAIAGMSPEFLSVILAIIVVYAMIAALIANSQGVTSAVRLTAEGQAIMRLFEAYADEKYRAFGELDDESRFGVGKNSGLRASRGIDNPDSERNKYKQVLDFVEQNEYQYELCAIWKIVYREMYAENHYRENSDLIDTSQAYGWESSEDAYKTLIQTYYTEDHGTENVRVGFESTYQPDDYPGNVYHQYYVNEAFKACLEAFIDENGNYILPITSLNEEITQANQDNTNASTTSGSNTAYTTPVSHVTRLSNDISAADYGSYLTNKIISNLDRGLRERISFKNPDNGTEYDGLEINYYSEVIAFHYYVDNTDNSIAPEDYNISDREVLADLKTKISASAAGFLEYTTAGNAESLILLARAQKGNHGQKYCDALFGGQLVDWCSIYAGWLLQEGGHIDISSYGWSAGVGVWEDNMKSKGLFRRRAEYTPKPGDVVFFGSDTYRTHVGIVIEVYEDSFLTSEGNTSASPGSGAYCSRSIVDEHTYSFDSTYVHGYGLITYDSALAGGNAMIHSTQSDPNYKCVSFRQWAGRDLTARERRIIEETVSGEFGNDYNGSVMIAQCIRDALVYGDCDKPANIPSRMGYDGYYAWNGKEPTSIAKDAVKYIFDQGGMGVKHRVLYMYNPTICTSAWHESQNYICSVGDVRFFDRWN